MKDIYALCTFKQRKDSFLRRGRFRWPYIKYKKYLAQPDTLASAGFAFTPAKDAPDNVQCFVCGFELTGWEETDDPFAEHYAHKPDCVYAQVHCRTRVARVGNKFEWNGWPIDLPPLVDLPEEEKAEETKKMMGVRADTNSRLQTFSVSKWPHMGRAGWMVTPEKLASAGFYFTPEWPGDDTTTCAFCGYALADWEPEDDPNAEHARRTPDCLFFRLAEARGSSVRSPEKPMVRSPVRTPVRMPLPVLVPEADAEPSAKRSSEHGSPAEAPNSVDGQGSRRSSTSSKRQRISETDEVSANENSDGTGDEEHTSPADANGVESLEDTNNVAPYAANGDVHDDVVILTDAESNAGGEDLIGATQVETDMLGHMSPIDMQIDLIGTENDPYTQETQLSHTQIDEYNLAGDAKHTLEEGEGEETEGAAAENPDMDDGEWDLDEDEENMSVEEFIRACCDHKITSLESSAAQMVSAFMQRAESTRERICNMTW
ncbi:hypothetical protein GGH99_001081 [Coemansia sp. RSA 1285]|nr:hypothetical protein GGH99_001081 [Coemansia sp. RSA 1285]